MSFMIVMSTLIVLFLVWLILDACEHSDDPNGPITIVMGGVLTILVFIMLVVFNIKTNQEKLQKSSHPQYEQVTEPLYRKK